METATLMITPEFLRLIAALDEFKGAWVAIGRISPDRLAAMRRVATIESIGSSTRIEGASLSDAEVERLLSRLDVTTFASRDEQEVAGYAAAMDLVFDSWPEIDLTENHIKHLHQVLLGHSAKDARHRSEYKTLDNHLEAFDPDGTSVARNSHEFAEGMRSVNCGRHVVFFAPVSSSGNQSVVLRIIHQRRNLPALAYFDQLEASRDR